MSAIIVSQWKTSTAIGLPIAQKKSKLLTPIRAREPVNNSFGRVRGKFPSRKMNRMIHWESQLERDAILIFEFSHGVSAYREQPHTTNHFLNERSHRYTPDFELILKSNEVQYVEIKPAEKLLDPVERVRFKNIERHYFRYGFTFWIFQDHQIRQAELLVNLGLMAKYRGMPFSLFERRQLIEKLSKTPQTTFKKVTALLGDPRTTWRLIAEQILFCDLRKIVNEDTKLNIQPKENFDHELFF